MRFRLATLALLAIGVPIVTGCAAQPGPNICARPDREEPIDYTGGTTDGDVYETGPWDDELLHFPGGAYYRVHHDLGAVPTQVNFYLSFERDGLAEGSVAEAAGNQVEIKEIDTQTVTFLNGSCAEYWLRAVVRL